MIQQDTKKMLWRLRTCSRTFFHLLNREFGHLKETEEQAANALAGGIRLKGYQCGMLWGASLAVGTESFRRHDDCCQAIGISIVTTQYLIKSFSENAESVNCRDITGCDFSSKLDLVKYIFSGKFLSCFNLAEKWAPEAIKSATEGLSLKITNLSEVPISCASEVVKKMGGSDEEIVMVAGFAGGLGLSGNACGALSAAIWMNNLARHKKQTNSDIIKTTSHSKAEIGKFTYPSTTNTLKAFCGMTDSKFLCHEISGQYFKTIDDHTRFVKNGGCHKLIKMLTRSRYS